MLKKWRPWLRSQVLITFTQAGNIPSSFRLELKKLVSVFTTLSLLWLLTFIGSLLFFREMELNRKLTERVLRLQLSHRFLEEAVKEAKSENPLAVGSKQAVQLPFTHEEERQNKRSLSERAKLNDLHIDCASTECTVKLTLAPLTQTRASGEILLVLESEVPRIGNFSASGALRKRFMIYPGGAVRESLEEKDVASLERKQFRFNRALQTTAVFQLKSISRPLALHVYLYDSSQNLIHHERKLIEVIND